MRKLFEQIKLWGSIITGIAVIVMLIGCATLSSTGTITVLDNGVTFDSPRPAKMSMKKGDIEYTYDSQTESWVSKIIGILTLGVFAK